MTRAVRLENGSVVPATYALEEELDHANDEQILETLSPSLVARYLFEEMQPPPWARSSERT